MTQQHLLPKFGSGKEAEEKAPVPPSPPLPPAARVAKHLVSSVELIEQNEGAPMNVAEADASNQAQPVASARPAAAARSRWARFKNPFQSHPPVRKVTAPVQAELSLDHVRVVRNDLNETDLEIVPARNRPETPAPSSPRLVSPQTAKLAWGRIRSRLFGPRRT